LGQKDKKNKKDKAAIPLENTIPLGINTAFTTIAPMTVEEKRAARNRYCDLISHIFLHFAQFFLCIRLRSIDVEEAAKARREEARNTFESYLYRLRDLLNEDNKDTPFKKCSQESERSAIAEKLDESFVWLHDRGELAETSQFLDKRIALEWVFLRSWFPSNVLILIPFSKNARKAHYPSLPRNRGFPSSLEQFPDVELVYSSVPYRSPRKPHRRSICRPPLQMDERRVGRTRKDAARP
jgi:hypothetical protein